MPENKPDHKPDKPSAKPSAQDLVTRIGSKAARKLNAKNNASASVWFGLGMMGLIGWAIVVPTLLGASLGLWLDRHYPGGHSWTLALLMAGLTMGCFNAWHWVDKETQKLRDQQNNDGPNKEERKHDEQ